LTDPSVGIQLYSVRKALANDFFGTLERIAEIGYQNIEMYFESPYFARFDVPCPSAELRKKTGELGLNILNSHVVHHKYLNWDEVIRYNVEIGSGGITIPLYLYNLNQNNSQVEEALEFSEWMNQFGKKCSENGMKLYYHNYFNEFEISDGKHIFDILLENTDPDYVGFELDVYWTKRGGVDPVNWMDRVGTRCELLQVQDLRADAKNINLVETVSSFDNAFWPKIHTHYGDYTEIGTGILDLCGIIKKAKELGSVSCVVSSQMEAGKKSELESAKENYETLQKLVKGL